MKKNNDIVIYKTKSGAIEFRADIKKETLWATQAQMAAVFGVNPQAVTKHLKNIYKEKELVRSATCSKMEQVRKEGRRLVRRQVDVYNLDAIISVGYRISSKTGTKFRQWATRVLRNHVVDGYTLNRKRLGENYKLFLDAVDKMKRVLPEADGARTAEALEIIKLFADTWFSLHAYDKGLFPESGASKKHVDMTAQELSEALVELKNAVVRKKEAGDLFGQEKKAGTLDGIVGNVFQSFDGSDLYPTIEEKAAYILYFIVKNHPFVDGNKRSGAFAFVWFLKKAGVLDLSRFTPIALTALTLLIAESRPSDRDNMIGLILMLLKR
jgi:prophage maintenance system killer protein